MDYELALEIFKQARETRWTDLWRDVVDTAVRYARYRVDWLRAEAEKQRLIGAERSTCHNALIVACDILARNMTTAGEDATWRRKLGTDRKDIGDFACHLHCILGVMAR